jgi:manganese oxidase
MSMWERLIAWGIAGAVLTAHPEAATAWQHDVSTRGANETVVANDNTRPAGVSRDGTVTIRLRAGMGTWRPEGGGVALDVEAFGLEDAPLSVPAPLIRVREGDRLVVSIRNDLATALRVHGLCTRDGTACAPIDVAPGEFQEVQFASGLSGTYHYWATTLGAPVPFRELAGAIVVDPGDARTAGDRIFVITEWTSLTPEQLRQILAADDATAAFVGMHPRLTFVINGLSWPATERLTYRRGELVRWRVINLSSQTHPMHLHGFYFTVTRTGDGRRDEPAAGGEGRRVVTHMLPAGGTMTMEWTPEREGNWLFHCHVMHHVSPDRRLGGDPPATHGHGEHAQHHGQAHDASLGMAGMVLGITVLPGRDASGPARASAGLRRQLTMVLEPMDTSDGGPVAGITVSQGPSAAAGARASSPGPVVVLRRDEPVEITVVNRLPEATSIHWHGLELDSYYDGVHGWSGSGRRVAPMIAPGESFVVRITPPRAGTFIYHTHLHDYRQLSSGLYGALIVTEPHETYDPATDHVVVLGRDRVSETSSLLQEADTVVVNGARAPQLSFRAGARNRIRIINITPDDILSVSLLVRDTPVMWQPVTKDGAPVPAAEREPSPAKVRIAVGETYDFAYEVPAGRAMLWLDVRTSGGRWLSQARVLIR